MALKVKAKASPEKLAENAKEKEERGLKEERFYKALGRFKNFKGLTVIPSDDAGHIEDRRQERGITLSLKDILSLDRYKEARRYMNLDGKTETYLLLKSGSELVLGLGFSLKGSVLTLTTVLDSKKVTDNEDHTIENTPNSVVIPLPW